jgi:PIN domain nuclease of toxin-antitoxin system
MRLMLDTHVAIWALETPQKLGLDARRLIDDAANDIAVSVVTIWEIAIKRGLGARPGRPPFSGKEAIRFFAEAGFDLLPVGPDHAAAVEHLPRIHADPFDRLLVAQALTEPMRLMSVDDHVLAYGPDFIDARV